MAEVLKLLKNKLNKLKLNRNIRGKKKQNKITKKQMKTENIKNLIVFINTSIEIILKQH